MTIRYSQPLTNTSIERKDRSSTMGRAKQTREATDGNFSRKLSVSSAASLHSDLMHGIWSIQLSENKTLLELGLPSLELLHKGKSDRYPLLMERPTSNSSQEHVIDVTTRSGVASSSSFRIPRGQEEEGHRSTGTRWWNGLRRGMGVGTTSLRLSTIIERFKMALDCFFAVWFVVGNVWIFGGHSSSSEAPNLYRLCIVFLTFSCIGYAMPFILCAAICCCLPCIISVLGFREDLGLTRGAALESINILPTYKFKSKRTRNRGQSELNSEGTGEGGILAAGTDKERTVSAEDAVCCICLAKYVDNDELRELPCTHFFHMACVDKWLKINASCPLCKSERSDYKQYESMQLP
ncbi:hypothetical protein MRB53_006375 [Persea americana]|uniref:Uncharacterized protein n=1 Tax=Persea americana TaxID=3435 RepID=A0ACC2MHI0_PERAE|nr:hypothetical protein MRB53_006375 [Persea americana]